MGRALSVNSSWNDFRTLAATPSAPPSATALAKSMSVSSHKILA